jgi:protein-tyrosine phosphatase
VTSSSIQRRVIDWIPGALNLRDFGGYPNEDGRMVGMGLLYRSGLTHAIPTEGIASIVSGLGIRTVIDLRGHGERERGLSAFESLDVRCIHEPLGTDLGVPSGAAFQELARRIVHGEFDWAARYWSMLTLNGDRFARILDVLSEPAALPALVHCTGGRDRTGVTVAVIQAALGVGDAEIAADYALSTELLLGADNPEFARLFSNLDVPRVDIERALHGPQHDAVTLRAHQARIRRHQPVA